MKFLKQKNITIICLAFFMLFLGAQKTQADATMPGGFLCASVEGNTGNCATVCASGLFQANYEPSDGGFSGYTCIDKKSNGAVCSADKNCTSSYCGPTTRKCEANASVVPTELPGGATCSTTEVSAGNCATSCASGLSEKKYSSVDGGFESWQCIAQKSTGEACTANKECVSTTCDVASTRKCIVMDSTYNPAGYTAGTPISQIYSVPGASVDANSGIVKCGRPGGQMCTLCDLIKGIHEIVKYIMGIAVGIALLAMAIGGVLYVASAGGSAMMEMAKSAIKNAAIGFVIVFAAYLIVNTTVTYLGATGTLGMKTTTTWGNFDCMATNK